MQTKFLIFVSAVFLLLMSCGMTPQKTPPQPAEPTNVITVVDTIEVVKTFHKISNGLFEFSRISTSDSLGTGESVTGERQICQAECVIDGIKYYILFYSDDVHRYEIGDILCIDLKNIERKRHTIYSQNALLYFGVHNNKAHKK